MSSIRYTFLVQIMLILHLQHVIYHASHASPGQSIDSHEKGTNQTNENSNSQEEGANQTKETPNPPLLPPKRAKFTPTIAPFVPHDLPENKRMEHVERHRDFVSRRCLLLKD
jgi:hypothetical protein